MSKSHSLNRWLWKWHIIAGLITLPFMILLAITGSIYLFKDIYEEDRYQHLMQVQPEGDPLPYTVQLQAAQAASNRPINAVVLPGRPDQAVVFTSGMRREKTSVYVNPYTGEVLGEVVAADTLMMKIRKLHGELLLGKPGTYTVELVASWFVVLLLTGIYVWWPSKGFSLGGFFTIRTKKGRRIFYRDLHSVTAFWLSVFMLVILAGAMPWTDVFGAQLKWVQKQTGTGYPVTWQKPMGIKSTPVGTALSLDEVAALATSRGLEGAITIKLPKGPSGVYSVSNRAFWLSDQEVLHLDQYSGVTLKQHTWKDVGILMDMRQVAMRLHQGEYGPVNWYLVLFTAIFFAVSTIAGLVSYVMRKPAGAWGLPQVPEGWKVSYVLVAVIAGLGILFPLFGASLLLLLLTGLGRGRRLAAGTAATP